MFASGRWTSTKSVPYAGEFSSEILLFSTRMPWLEFWRWQRWPTKSCVHWLSNAPVHRHFPVVQWNVTFPSKPKPTPKPPQPPSVGRWRSPMILTNSFVALIPETDRFTSVWYACWFFLQTWFSSRLSPTALLSSWSTRSVHSHPPTQIERTSSFVTVPGHVGAGFWWETELMCESRKIFTWILCRGDYRKLWYSILDSWSHFKVRRSNRTGALYHLFLYAGKRIRDDLGWFYLLYRWLAGPQRLESIPFWSSLLYQYNQRYVEANFPE